MRKCPRCKIRLYFDDDYYAPSNGKYEMCKFCGYWKNKKGIQQCTIFYHNCEDPNHPRKGYCWVTGTAKKVFCERCEKVITRKVLWPYEEIKNRLEKNANKIPKQRLSSRLAS